MLRCAGGSVSLQYPTPQLLPLTLDAKGTDLIEVVTVQVGVDTEEPPEDCPDGIPETLWERGAWVCNYE